MFGRWVIAGSVSAAMAVGAAVVSAPAQQAPPASGARILLLPRHIVSGEHATLAVLDVNGRLTPKASVTFSNGDHLKTDATGRALFVAPLDLGVISAVIEGRAGRVLTTIVGRVDTTAAETEVTIAPRVASLSDRFELEGHGFCGDADANSVTIAGRAALILAASPTSLVVLPPTDLDAGEAPVQVSCAKRDAEPFSMKFVALSLEADSSPLKPGDHRTLTVRVQGTTTKVSLEARNLAPEVAELSEAKTASSGGADNVARFALVGKKAGSFLISIHLVGMPGAPRR
jgi:hypothetical protein